MSREAHVRICEGVGVRFPGATLLVAFSRCELCNRLIEYGSPLLGSFNTLSDGFAFLLGLSSGWGQLRQAHAHWSN